MGCGGGEGEGVGELEEEVLFLLGGAAGTDVTVEIDEVVLEGFAADEAVAGGDVGEETGRSRTGRR